jgi:adhesin transport system membrane fusion protein
MISEYFKLNDTKKMILKAPTKLRIVLWFWVLTVFLFLLWASFAKVDEIVRADGKIIPSGKNQIVQNLEGGIIKDILVSEGDIIKKGDILIQIQNQKSISSFEENELKVDELRAKVARLKAQAYSVNLNFDEELKDEINLVNREKSLYNTNIKKLNSRINIFNEQIKQEQSNLKESKNTIGHLKRSKDLLSQELEMLEPLVIKGIRAKVDLLRLKQELNGIEQKLDTTKESIPRIKSTINEIKNKKEEVKNDFKSEAKEELNKNVMQLQRIQVSTKSAEDSVLRTEVSSPANGIVQKLFIHTIGGVIQPGEDLIQIVPTDDTLLVEARVKPSDIAFLYAKQEVVVKFTAYDFSIFGSLKGNIIKISADTQVDENGNSFYSILIKTNKNYLLKANKKLPIIPGMVVNIDILTGKKSVLDYILKPIIKTKAYTFTER